MTWQGIGIGTLLAGLLVTWFAIRRLRARHLLTGFCAGGLAAGMLCAGALLVGLSIGFQVLGHAVGEQQVGTIVLRQTGTKEFNATLILDDLHKERRYRLVGDQWHLHVRFLKWTVPATLLGAQSLYQLDRLNGRYEEPDAVDHAELTAYSLSNEPGQALWKLATGTRRWLPWIDAVYGTSVYLPMADGATYRISVTDSGLIARASNDAARHAVDSW